MELYQMPLIGQKRWQQPGFQSQVLVPFISQVKEGFLCGAVWTDTRTESERYGSASAENLVVGCE